MRADLSSLAGRLALTIGFGIVAAGRSDLHGEPRQGQLHAADAQAASAAASPTSSATPAAPPAAAGQAAAPATAQAPAPGAAPQAVGDAAVRIYMPDGQLESHSVRVYVTREIQTGQNPRLRLLRSHAVTRRAVDEAAPFEPGIVAPGQEWMETVGGQQVRRTGTLLLFDLSGIDFGIKAMLRVVPVVSWTEAGTTRVAVGSHDVNLGNIVAAVAWTTVIVGAALAVVVWLARRGGGHPLLLLTAVDGHLSLAQAQIACWTLAVGGVVVGYGLIRLEIPSIPASLLVLMGASLATGGVGYFQDARQLAQAARAGVPVAAHGMTLGDLVRVFPPGEAPELSLAKAQMLFWTMLLLVLFVSKSLLDGAIWEVPWPLVALMGFSQAGYLAPKLAAQP